MRSPLEFRTDAATDAALAPRAVLLVSGQPFPGCAGGVGALPFGKRRLLEGWLEALRPEVAWLGLAALPGGALPRLNPAALRGVRLLPDHDPAVLPATALPADLPPGVTQLAVLAADRPCPGREGLAPVWTATDAVPDSPPGWCPVENLPGAPLCAPDDYRRALAAARLCDADAPALMLELYGSLRQRSGLAALPLHARTMAEALEALRAIAPETARIVPPQVPFAEAWRYAVNGGQVHSDDRMPLAGGDRVTLFSASVGG